GRVTGDLTLHGVTRPVTLDFEYLGAITDPMAGGTRVGFSAVGMLDREEFGLTYNATLDGGGVMIGKSISLELEVEALRES
ncbi:MAG TPA: YceI family protein, partial [Actinobacteria bacterium]|nr:YceI family protein [Actinomycetota bacterium]